MLTEERYLEAAEGLEQEAARHVTMAERCRKAAASLRELAGEEPAAEPEPPRKRRARKKRVARKKRAVRKKRVGRAKAVAPKKAGVEKPKVMTLLCACGCGKPVPLTRKGRQPTRLNGHWSKRGAHVVEAKASSPPAEVAAPPPRSNGPAPTPAQVEAVRATRPARPFRCPQHGDVCRTQNLCKHRYTTAG